MAEGASKHLFLCLLFVLAFFSSGSFPTRELEDHEVLKRRDDHSCHHRKLHEQFQHKTTQHETIVYPNSPPTTVTVPASSTVPPTSNPTNPPAVPITNPVTTPSTIPAGAQPATNPVTTFPSPTSGGGGGGVPVTAPPGGVVAAVPPPASSGGGGAASPGVSGQQGWCVAKSGTVESALQSALDYACGTGGVDCSAIQEGASCYNPNTLAYHASYAFNSYYQKNPMQTSCDFGGTAALSNTNPSTGTCVFSTSSSSSTSSGATNPPTTDSSSSAAGAAAGSRTTNPVMLNTTYPAASSFGAFNSSTTSMATTTQPPFIGLYTILVTSVVTAKFTLHHVGN